MKVKYNKQTHVMTFGKKGEIKLTPSIKDRDKDFTEFDVLNGLQVSLAYDQKKTNNTWDIYALNAISNAMMFLHMKRLYAIAKDANNAKSKSKTNKKASKKNK